MMKVHSGNETRDAKQHSSDTYLPVIATLILLGVVIRVWLASTTHATEEDFYITLRYAENIASGRGFVYNPGEHVLGVTTPLYALLLALIKWVGWNPVAGAKGIGIVSDALAAFFTYRLSRVIGRPVAGMCAVLCLMLGPTNLIWSTKGMEVGLVAAVAAGTWCAWAEKRELAAWCGAAILVLLRIDGIALAVIMLIATMVIRRQMPWRGLGLFVILIAPWALFAMHTFGSAVPLSLSAKLRVYAKLIPGTFPQLRPFLGLILHNPLGLICAIGTLCFVGFTVSRRSALPEQQARDRILLPCLIWICTHYAGMALSHVVLFGWYFVPPTPIYYLVAFTGWSAAVGALTVAGSSQLLSTPSRTGGIVLAVAFLVAAVVTPRVYHTLQEGQRVERDLRIPIGLWLRNNARPSDSVMLEPIGYIGYYSRLRVIDVIGLVSPEALPSYGPEIPCPDHDLWHRLSPTWLLLRAGQWKTLRQYEETLPDNQRIESYYHAVQLFRDPTSRGGFPDFILLRRDQN